MFNYVTSYCVYCVVPGQQLTQGRTTFTTKCNRSHSLREIPANFYLHDLQYLSGQSSRSTPLPNGSLNNTAGVFWKFSLSSTASVYLWHSARVVVLWHVFSRQNEIDHRLNAIGKSIPPPSARNICSWISSGITTPSRVAVSTLILKGKLLRQI